MTKYEALLFAADILEKEDKAIKANGKKDHNYQDAIWDLKCIAKDDYLPEPATMESYRQSDDRIDKAIAFVDVKIKELNKYILNASGRSQLNNWEEVKQYLLTLKQKV